MIKKFEKVNYCTFFSLLKGDYGYLIFSVAIWEGLSLYVCLKDLRLNKIKNQKGGFAVVGVLL
jgi:hypothetical protein